MRFAGTCNRYSNSATPHEISAATHQARFSSSLRCPYHAKVMNRFEKHSSTAQTTAGWRTDGTGLIEGAVMAVGTGAWPPSDNWGGPALCRMTSACSLRKVALANESMV